MKYDDFFLVKPTKYSRNKIIYNLLKNKLPNNNFKILPPFKKKYFFKYLFSNKIIINDFFVSDFDSQCFDRKTTKIFSLESLKYYIIDFLNFHLSDYLLSDTKTHLKRWNKLFGKRYKETFIIPVLADTKTYFPKKYNKNNKINILFYGSFIPLHGIEIILTAIKKLKQKKVRFHLNLIGKGPTDIFAKKYIKKHNLEDVINFQNKYITERKLAIEINKNDIILGIFGESEKAHSVIPNKVYQGLACKKTVITMYSKAIREFFNSSEVICSKNNPNSLSNTIKYYINNNNKRHQIANNGFERFKKLYYYYEKNTSKFLFQNEKIN